MDALAEAIVALPPQVRSHFGLAGDPPSADRSLTALLDLTGQAVLVTGGAGADLGSALCRRLAGLGATVGILDVDAAATRALTTEIAGSMPIEADVSDWDAIHRGIDGFVAQVGRIDILINNAGGGFGTHGPFATRSQRDIDVVVATNLTGVLYATSAALVHMRAQRSGRIITIASEGGRIAMRDLAVYNTCKAAVIAFMRNLAREVGAEGISTVTVCPGGLLGPKLVGRMAAWPAPLASAIDQGLAATPLGRFGTPDEVAVAVAFLASAAGAFISGTEISVSGGQSA